MEMGNGKQQKWETGDEKMGIFLHNCIACPLCIQQHLLERTSATGDSGEEVEHMHDQLNTQKKYYRPSRVLCGCVIIIQDMQNLFMGSTS